MPDMNEKFPCVEPDDYANGTIQSEADSNLCVEMFGYPALPRLNECRSDFKLQRMKQHFALDWHRNIQHNKSYYHCLDTKTWSFVYCTYKFKKQIWNYNLTTHQIVNPYSKTCLTAVTDEKSVFMKMCNPEDKNQKWKWGNTNENALRNWETYGEKLPNDTRYLYSG